MNFSAAEIAELMPFMTAAELREIDSYIDHDPNKVFPQPGPQTTAYFTAADWVLYGGSAGGGKTFLAILKALTKHRRSLILRREFPQLGGIIETANDVYAPYGEKSGRFWNCVYEGKTRSIEFGACQYEANKSKYQGRPKDLYVFDEAANFTETMVTFITAWNRHEDPTQHAQVLLCSNPPTDATGDWLVVWFAPWLDPSHPNPALPGELRWYAAIDGKQVPVADSRKFVMVCTEMVFDFDASKYKATEIIKPKSRTFIPASVTDNAFYADGGYIATLQALPEPLRSKMLFGDFTAGKEESEWQVIPSAHVKLAQERWKLRAKPTTPMTALGADIARGGRDKTTLAPRYDNYFGEIVSIPGIETPNGQTAAARILQISESGTCINVDTIGVGAATYDALEMNNIEDVYAMNGSEGSSERDRSGRLGFINKRAEWWWRMRESLCPINGDDICLPPDPELLADLCSANWKLSARGIQIESKDEIKKRIGRSPDKGDAAVYANADVAGGGYAVSVNRGLK